MQHKGRLGEVQPVGSLEFQTVDIRGIIGEDNAVAPAIGGVEGEMDVRRLFVVVEIAKYTIVVIAPLAFCYSVATSVFKNPQMKYPRGILYGYQAVDRIVLGVYWGDYLFAAPCQRGVGWKNVEVAGSN